MADSSSSDEVLPRRKSLGKLSRNPRPIPRLLLESSSDEEVPPPKMDTKDYRETQDDREIHPKEDIGAEEENHLQIAVQEVLVTEVAEKEEESIPQRHSEPSDAPTSNLQLAESRSLEDQVHRTGWRFKSKDAQRGGNSADRSKSPRSPRRARWNSQAMKLHDVTSEPKVFDRLYNDFLQKTQAGRVPSKSPKTKDPERSQVFSRLYADALVKREEVAKKREAKEKREEQQLVRLQAPEEQVMAMCQRLYDQRKVKEPPKPQDPAEVLENSKKLHSFVHHQTVWNANRVARAEAERLRQLDSERKYLEENSIHRSPPSVNGCHDRLYKDFDKRTARLEKLRAQQTQEQVTPTSPRSVDTAQVSARLHQHFEERKLRLDQKRKEQDDFIRWRSQDPRRLRSRSGSPRTPSTATAVSQTSSDTWRTRSGTPRGGALSRCVTPDKSRSPRAARSPGPPAASPPAPLEASSGPVEEAAAPPGLRAEVEMDIISARGNLENSSWTCSVEVGEAAKLKRILQTPPQSDSPWNFKAKATLLQADVLQFKLCNGSGECVAQTSLSVASILMICYSGFDGELKLQRVGMALNEDDAIYLHVAMRVLDVFEPRIAKLELEPEKPEEKLEKSKKAEPGGGTSKASRPVHPHEGYKVKPYGIVAEAKAKAKCKAKPKASTRPTSASPKLSTEILEVSRNAEEVSKSGTATKVRQGSRMRSVSFDRSARTRRRSTAKRGNGDSYEFEILIEDPFVTVHIEDRFLPQHLRLESA